MLDPFHIQQVSYTQKDVQNDVHKFTITTV